MTARAALVLLAAACATPAAADKEKRPMDPLDADFQSVVDNSGAAYARSLERLLAAGPRLGPVLEPRRQSRDPMVQLVVTILDDPAASARLRQEALHLLESEETKMQRTAVGYPPPLGLADLLDARFSSRAVPVLALELAKQDGWPWWRTGGVLLYIARHPPPPASAAPISLALIRFAVRANERREREAAITTIRTLADPGLPDRLASERTRHPTWPAGLDGLEKELRAGKTD